MLVGGSRGRVAGDLVPVGADLAVSADVLVVDHVVVVLDASTVEVVIAVNAVGGGKRFLKELAECVAEAEAEVAGAPAGSSSE